MRGIAGIAAVLVASGCLVGPRYERPGALVRDRWIEAGDPALRDGAADGAWWRVFGDPTLETLVARAYAENLGLRAAGLRVVEAQARRAITIGTLYPQTQDVTASYTRTRQSANTALGALGGTDIDAFQAGFDAAWEIDVWGRFRRAIEADDATLLAAVASYDDVLVSLVAEVARTYLAIRVDDERLAVARDNVRVQADGLRIANVRFQAGGTSRLDVEQARTLLRDTEATIPQLEIALRQSADSLCLLLGVPPQDLTAVLGGPGRVPDVPDSVTVGIPADVIRRRPDVRNAERAAAAQSARIGVAEADLLPAFQLVGSVGLSAADAAKFFAGRSFTGSTGPAVTWPILNYGRLRNNVRLQDATFQELATDYANTVLVAQRDVEDALTAYLRGRVRVTSLTEAVDAANRAVDLSLIQYREGGTDFTAVLNAQQAKLREDDQLVSTRGDVALAVVSLFKALGGGWELRNADDFVPAETRETMAQRTSWGGMIAPDRRAHDVAQAARDAEPRRWWEWRWWWPEW